MKKLLGLLAAFGMTAATTATVVACGPTTPADEIVAPDATVTEVSKLEISEVVKSLKEKNESIKDLIFAELPAAKELKQIAYVVKEQKTPEAFADKDKVSKTFVVEKSIVIAGEKEGSFAWDKAEKVLEFTLTVGSPSETTKLEALKAEITKAKEIKQGKKTPEAFEKLQDAIKVAESVTEEGKADAAKTALTLAVKVFNESKDA